MNGKFRQKLLITSNLSHFLKLIPHVVTTRIAVLLSNFIWMCSVLIQLPTIWSNSEIYYFRSSHPEVLLGKGVLKIYNKFTGNTNAGVISIKLFWSFIEITLRYRWSPANLLHIYRTHFLENTSGRLLLDVCNFPFPQTIFRTYRSSRPKVFCKTGIFRNFAKFTGKHLSQSLFFNKVASLWIESFI